MPNELERAEGFVDRDAGAQIRGERGEMLSIYVCPDCGGVLWQVEVDGQMAFRCHVGHVLSALSFQEQQLAAIEAATWTSVRTLMDRSRFLNQMATRARAEGDNEGADRCERQAQAAEQLSGEIRRLIEAKDTLGNPDEPHSVSLTQ